MNTVIVNAIQTTALAATNTKGHRIKAVCWRGSCAVAYNYELSVTENHIAAAKALCAKILAEDLKRHGGKKGYIESKKILEQPMISAVLPNQDYCHVFDISALTESNIPDDLAQKYGVRIAEIFAVRRSSSNRSRYSMAWGIKTSIGIFRIFERIANEIKTNTFTS